MIHGYDISNTNGYITIPADAEFVIAKVSQDVSFVDRHFGIHRTTARQREVGFGGYHYGDNQAQPDAESSCNFFLELLGEQQDGEIAALDVEGNYGYGGFEPNRPENQPWVLTWGRTFLKLKNYKSKLYTSVVGLTDYNLQHPEIPELFDLWLAYWTDSTEPPAAPAPFNSYQLWQYNARTIDKNKFFGTLEEFKATGKQPSVISNNYETSYWSPMYELINNMVANSKYPHADAAFHAAISNVITLHKIALDVESNT